MELCVRVHLHTEKRREESERNSVRVVGGGDGEKKLLPARHLIWGRFWWWSQRDLIVPKTALSVCLCPHEHVFMQGRKADFIIFCLMFSVADRPLTAEPI